MGAKTIDPASLAELLASSHPPLLLDVRLDTAYAREHLPGAKNNCVFEVAFLDRLKEMAPDLERPVCVYGECSDSHESLMAAEKLGHAGYKEIFELRCGIEDWIAAGQPVERNEAETASAVPSLQGEIPINLDESRIRWIGRNLLNMHEGYLALKSGHLRFEDGTLTGGEFTIDMHSIRSTDLEGNDLHDVLIRHLMDHDFFEVEKYPEARFVIDRATEVAGAEAGAPNLEIEGKLTLKDVTAALAFTAISGITAGGKAAAQASFAIDRTKWNVRYGSGRLFRNLGGHLVNDMIELQLRIVTQ